MLMFTIYHGMNNMRWFLAATDVENFFDMWVNFALPAKTKTTLSWVVYVWCDFTPKSEPISQPNANLSRAACPPKGGRAPPAAPFAFF